MAEVTVPAFIAKWSASRRTERAAAQEHFIDLCRLLGEQTPNEADPTGEDYAFEKGATKTSGGQGWADVWKRDRFAWEYKGKHANLRAAYQQLLQYREDLDNPPLLVVCDLDRFAVHTNFTGTAKRVYAFSLADLAAPVATEGSALPPLDVLRAVFAAPERLRPERTAEYVTEQAAAEFATLAESLRQRGVAPERAAHFLMRLLFCLFAEDIELLPRRLFTRLVEQTRRRPSVFGELLRELFAKMRAGGFFGIDEIAYFNGGLFGNDTPGLHDLSSQRSVQPWRSDDQTLELTRADLAVLERAARLDWASVEPAIFGTLFERSLDPDKRSQLGAHYTSREDILLIVEPVLIAPLRRRWAAVRAQAEELIARRDEASGGVRTRRERELERLLMEFAGEIAGIRVLDPACGSGNFLYVALKRLLDLEKEVSLFAAQHARLSGLLPQVQPGQLYGIEVNTYAHELASVVVWIGYIQWLHENGFGIPDKPILKPLDNIRRTDAILADGPGQPIEPAWPAADIIIGNPPFLGGKRLRAELGDDYVDRLFRLYDGRVPREADLVTYWFERARALIADGRVQRAGLLATQAIRGGANRRVLEGIKGTGDIFMAWSDRKWVLDGAAVQVSIVGFDAGAETAYTLDGEPVKTINANLTSALDLTQAQRLGENMNLSFMGDTKGGAFDIPDQLAQEMLGAPLNPNGRPNSDVVRPWVNGMDITRRSRGMWIIDFGVDMPEGQAALYESPFAYVLQHVRPVRTASRTTRPEWWLHERPRPEMREAFAPLSRFIGTTMVAKHRIFVWLPSETIPANVVIVMARDDDYFFGVLHSTAHELWARATGTQLREAESGFRYTPTTTFETFPCPWPPGQEPADDPRVGAIAAAARELVALRDRWLDPVGAAARELKGRTLTNLYNARPTWLDLAHRRLDAAVLAAYGWPADLGGEVLLERLLALNLARGG